MKEVEAVKTKEEIMMVERLLRAHHSDLYADIWRIGVNLSLRISDLLAIRFADLDLDNHLYTLAEGKTKKSRHIRLNPTALSLIGKRREQYPDDTYLFQVHSNRTASLMKPVSRISVARAFKDIGDRIGIHIGTHSMRKSRGWAMLPGVNYFVRSASIILAGLLMRVLLVDSSLVGVGYVRLLLGKRIGRSP